MDLEGLRIFTLLDYEINDSNLKKLIDYVLKMIPDEYEENFPSFSIYEGIAKEGANVTEDLIIFDVGRLNELSDDDEDVKIGVIAHELAHVFCRHATAPDIGKRGLEHEDEADKLASDWGFANEVVAFRRKLGPATRGP